MTSADKVCLSHLSGSLIKTIKKFSKEGGRAKTRKKGRERCLIQFISELCLPFPFLLQASFRPLLPSIDFPDSGSLQNQQT